MASARVASETGTTQAANHQKCPASTLRRRQLKPPRPAANAAAAPSAAGSQGPEAASAWGRLVGVMVIFRWSAAG